MFLGEKLEQVRAMIAQKNTAVAEENRKEVTVEIEVKIMELWVQAKVYDDE